MLFYLFSSYLHTWSSPTQRIHHNIFCITYSRICRGNLPWLFAMSFLFVSKSFFAYVSKSSLYESKPFLYVRKFFLFVKFSFLTVFLFVIAVAVMSHCTSPFHNDWPIFQKNYLTFTSKTFHFLPGLFPALHRFKAEILINKNIATFKLLYIIKDVLLLLVRPKHTNNSSCFITARLSFRVMCSHYVNVFEA